MKISSSILLFLLLTQTIFAQETELIETPFSKGIIFNEKKASGSGKFTPDKKEIMAFEEMLQEIITEIKAGKTEHLPQHILNIDFSSYYRAYTGLDSDRAKRILVIFIPKTAVENLGESKTWEQLYETKGRFNASYYLKDNKIFFPVHCEN